VSARDSVIKLRVARTPHGLPADAKLKSGSIARILANNLT
jgi:hypothetical protein